MATPSSKTTEGVIESVALKRTAVGRRRPARAATNEPKTIQNEISMSAPDRPREPAPYDESDSPARVQARSGLALKVPEAHDEAFSVTIFSTYEERAKRNEEKCSEYEYVDLRVVCSREE